MELSSKHCRCIQLQTTTARVLKFGGLIGNLKTLRAVTMRLKNNVLFKYKLDLNTKIIELGNDQHFRLLQRIFYFRFLPSLTQVWSCLLALISDAEWQ